MYLRLERASVGKRNGKKNSNKWEKKELIHIHLFYSLFFFFFLLFFKENVVNAYKHKYHKYMLMCVCAACDLQCLYFSRSKTRGKKEQKTERNENSWQLLLTYYVYTYFILFPFQMCWLRGCACHENGEILQQQITITKYQFKYGKC